MKPGYKWWITLWKAAKPFLFILAGPVIERLEDTGYSFIALFDPKWLDHLGGVFIAGAVLAIFFGGKNIIKQRNGNGNATNPK